MHTTFEGPGPSFVNPCGVSAGTITTSPGPAASRSSPARKVRWPAMTTQVSSQGVAMQPWAVPGLALVENERDAGAVVFAHEVPGGDRVGLDQGHAVTLPADVVPVRRAYHAAHG